MNSFVFPLESPGVVLKYLRRGRLLMRSGEALVLIPFESQEVEVCINYVIGFRKYLRLIMIDAMKLETTSSRQLSTVSRGFTFRRHFGTRPEGRSGFFNSGDY